MKNGKKWLTWVIVLIVLFGLVVAGLLLVRLKFKSATDNVNINDEIDCSSDIYDCNDFSDQEIAQITYKKCISEVGHDVHNLDKDSDGIACESMR